jgi:DNA-binding response OmpR family regulator
MRVLVVEDNLPVAESIRTMLEARKYAANVVTSG